jgi:hypothetical protein
MTEVEPVLHSHDRAQTTNSPYGEPAQYQTSRLRICGGTSRTDTGLHRVLHIADFQGYSITASHSVIHLSITDGI